MNPRIVFFGTPDYSLIVTNKLYQAGYPFACVVTKPPRPFGRKHELIDTAVASWAKTKHLQLLTPPSSPDKPWLFVNEESVANEVLKLSPDLIISADYTQKIPMNLVNQVKFGGLNIHPSLLPSYRGPAPVPWAIFNGESETGVSIVTLSEKFDAGQIIAQEKELILPSDSTESLLTRLFTKGADLLIQTLPKYFKNPTSNFELITNIYPSYFPRLTRDHGFEPWDNIKKAIINGEGADRIYRKWRAFHPWPGLWTKVKIAVQSSRLHLPLARVNGGQAKFIDEKRLKLLKVHLDTKPSPLNPRLILDEIQMEGKKPVQKKQLTDLLEQIDR